MQHRCIDRWKGANTERTAQFSTNFIANDNLEQSAGIRNHKRVYIMLIKSVMIIIHVRRNFMHFTALAFMNTIDAKNGFFSRLASQYQLL